MSVTGPSTGERSIANPVPAQTTNRIVPATAARRCQEALRRRLPREDRDAGVPCSDVRSPVAYCSRTARRPAAVGRFGGSLFNSSAMAEASGSPQSGGGGSNPATAKTVGALVGRRFLPSAPAQPQQVRQMSWDSEMSGRAQDKSGMDMSKLDFENTACLNRPPENNGRFQETSCVVPHASEIFDSYEAPAPDEAAYPHQLRGAADDFCRTSYARYGNSSWLRDQDIRLTSLFPSEPRWNLGKEYSHAVYCVASRVDDDQMLPANGMKIAE